MGEEQLKQLIRKVNQIAVNQSAQGDAEMVCEKVYEHLLKFWSPLMKQELRDYISKGQQELTSEAYAAAKKPLTIDGAVYKLDKRQNLRLVFAVTLKREKV